MKASSSLKEFAKYTSLNVLGMIGLSCYILADTFFVSRGLGSSGLAALNLAVPVYSFIHGTGLMIGIGGGSKYSIRKGQQDHAAANRIFTNTLYLAAAFSLLFLIIGCFFSGPLVSLFGADPEIFPLSRTYLQTILLFAPAFLLNNILLAFVRNDGAPQLSMAAMLGGSLSNVILDWVFIFPCKMGMFGAAFATGLAPVISILILSLHFIRRKHQFHLTSCKIEWKQDAGILAAGLPSLVTEVSSGVVMIVFNALILRLEGNTGLAAYSVIANLSLVIIAVYTGVAQGIQPIVSRSYGIHQRAGGHAVLRYAFIVMFLFSVLIYAVIFFCAPQITGIFNSEQNPLLQDIASEGMRLYFIACPFAGFNIILSMYFASVERSRPASLLSLLRGFFIIIPMAFLLAWLGDIQGVWCAFPATEILAAGAGLIFLHNPGKKKIEGK